MSYRPIMDMWFLARAKLNGGIKYYGAYPGGFPERARALLGVAMGDPVLHLCSGMVRHYPYRRAMGPHDYTMDIDPATKPDIQHDIREPIPEEYYGLWKAVLADPPYTPEDAGKYERGSETFPSVNLVLKHALLSVPVGGRVGVLHYILPKPPAHMLMRCHLVAAVGILVGYNNRIRVYSVFEKLPRTWHDERDETFKA